MSVHHHVFDTTIGRCGVAWSERGLVAVQFPERDVAISERRLIAKSRSVGAAAPPAQIASVVGDIARYLAGERVDFSAIPVDLGGVDDFRRSLYEALRAVGLRHHHDVWRAGQAARPRRAGGGARRRRRDGPEPSADCHPLPSRAGSGRQARRISLRPAALPPNKNYWRSRVCISTVAHRACQGFDAMTFFETQTFLNKCVAAVVDRGLIAATELGHWRLSRRYRRLSRKQHDQPGR